MFIYMICLVSLEVVYSLPLMWNVWCWRQAVSGKFRLHQSSWPPPVVWCTRKGRKETFTLVAIGNLIKVSGIEMAGLSLPRRFPPLHLSLPSKKNLQFCHRCHRWTPVQQFLPGSRNNKVNIFNWTNQTDYYESNFKMASSLNMA